MPPSSQTRILLSRIKQKKPKHINRKYLSKQKKNNLKKDMIGKENNAKKHMFKNITRRKIFVDKNEWKIYNLLLFNQQKKTNSGAQTEIETSIKQNKKNTPPLKRHFPGNW